jgi:uncharacterized protein YndB with AHSA1/START domain
MTATIAIAPVHKSVIVKATPQRAFEIFTAGIDRWWPKTHGVGAGPIRQSIIEPYVGGRWYTTFEDGREAVVGHVLAWKPGATFGVTWEIDSGWKSDPRPAFTSEVHVLFVAEGDGSTRVQLEHRNFERMGAAEGQKLRNDVDGGWPKMLDLYATEVGHG